MVADVDSEKQKSVNPSLAACLYYYHMDRNKAIGIEEDNQFSTYLRLAGRQIIRTRESLNLWLLQLLNSQLVNIRDQTKNLIAAAKTPDEKRKVLPMVEGLLEQAEVISKEMDRLTNG